MRQFATQYATRKQRQLLQSIGVPHVRGRTRSVAMALIESAIAAGKLPPDRLTDDQKASIPIEQRLAAKKTIRE
jgi:hypothetical protein